jgi:sensor domain CHASE-containing protein
MSLRNKAITMTCVVFAAALVIIFVVSQTLLMKRFAGLERENTSQSTERAVSALYKDFSSMNITSGPMAFDSGSFAWVQDEQGMHMQINIDGPSFVGKGINYIAFIMAPSQPQAWDTICRQASQCLSLLGLLKSLCVVTTRFRYLHK